MHVVVLLFSFLFDAFELQSVMMPPALLILLEVKLSSRTEPLLFVCLLSKYIAFSSLTVCSCSTRLLENGQLSVPPLPFKKVTCGIAES